MQKRLKLFILPVLFIFCISLTGCYDAMEVDDEVYALSIGLDKGVGNKLSLSIQYPTYKSGGGSQGGDAKGVGSGASNAMEGYNVHTVEAPSILEGMDMLGMEIPRRVSLMHTKLLVFSEEIAREGAGDYLGPLARFRETRRTMVVVIVKGKAEDFLRKNKSTIGESLSKSIELIWAQSKNTSYFPFMQFNSFYRGILSPYEAATAVYGGTNNLKTASPGKGATDASLVVDKGLIPGEVPRAGVSETEFAGTAVFNGDHMVGYLNSYETRYYLLVMGKFHHGIITINDKLSPGNAIPVDIRTGRKPTMKNRFVNGVPEITVNLKVEADIGAIQSRINYEKYSMLGNLNQQIKEHLEKGIKKTIEKTQKELKADIFGFGHVVVNHFLTIQEWRAYNWPSHYPEAKVTVNVEVNTRRTGMMVYSAPIISSSGDEEVDQ